VINAACIKPLDEELSGPVGGKTSHVVTVEDHAVVGGLGGAVAELPHRRAPDGGQAAGCSWVRRVGRPEGLYAKHGLDPTGIAASVKKFLHS